MSTSSARRSALERIREAQTLADQTGDCRDVAEFWRLEGECLLAGNARPQRKAGAPREAVGAAERCFLRAVELARGQGARWFELRALTSLARLRISQGRSGEAGEALATALAWFTEGADTPAVKDARAVLARVG